MRSAERSHDRPAPRTTLDPEFGFRRLDPVPRDDELAAYYESRYYDRMRRAERSGGLHRLARGGTEAEGEVDWLEQTLHADVADALARLAPGRRVLEIGCGVGLLLHTLAQQGFEVLGIEPAPEAAEAARARGVRVVQARADEFAARHEGPPFDAIVLLNVLEHLPDPIRLLRTLHGVLAPGGTICVRVPNDFSEIQAHARAAAKLDEWWIVDPDHINYFDFASLARTLEGCGFEVVDALADYPMELFLLAGRNYVGHLEAGARCHAERVELERNLPAPFRRRLYRGFASLGIGRNCLMLARRGTGAAARPRVDLARFVAVRGPYTYVGLRHADIQQLATWRNQQLDVLRQSRPLTPADQERWFTEVVTPTHAAAEPAFLLVSILDAQQVFIGYGGLVHIDWRNLRAEVSFLVDTDRSLDPELYARDFRAFLGFVRELAFDTLGLARLWTETYAFREGHMQSLEAEGFQREGVLAGHTVHPHREGEFVDSILHGLRRAGP